MEEGWFLIARKISYWMLLSVYVGWLSLYLSLGRLTMASMSVVKSRDDLVEDLYLTILLSLSVLFITSGWWRILSALVLVIGVMGNNAGWNTESAKYHDSFMQRLAPGDPSVLILTIGVVVIISLMLFVLDPKRKKLHEESTERLH